MKPSGVLCCGNIVYDTIVKPVNELDWSQATTFVDTIDYRCGGSGASTARTLGILGIPVRLLSAVGSDDQARFLLNVIRASGVDISYIRQESVPTAATVALVDSRANRKFFHRLGSHGEAFAEAVRFDHKLCDGMSHFHLAGIFVLPGLRAHAPDLLQRAHDAGLTTSLDTNWDPEGQWMRTLEPCLPHVDLLFMNEDEARMITGYSTPALGANAILAHGVTACVLKLGSRGCVSYTAEGEIVCPAFEVNVSDTTGAGDCFVGGFLAARQRGASLAAAGQFANAVAALSVQKIGAVEGILPTAETEAWMRKTPLRQVTASV